MMFTVRVRRGDPFAPRLHEVINYAILFIMSWKPGVDNALAATATHPPSESNGNQERNVNQVPEGKGVSPVNNTQCHPAYG